MYVHFNDMINSFYRYFNRIIQPVPFGDFPLLHLVFLKAIYLASWEYGYHSFYNAIRFLKFLNKPKTTTDPFLCFVNFLQEAFQQFLKIYLSQDPMMRHL